MSFTNWTHCQPEQHVCVAEPLAFHFATDVNRLEQPHSQCEAAVAQHLENRCRLFFQCEAPVLSKNKL